MIDLLSISRETPSIRSMDFNLLREEGIRRIQELSGKIWTDYNVHDPGVMLLEVLCYALTDLGYRTSFDMKDLLASNPSDDITDNYQFFTARQILHNNALTILDFRKLIMDVSVLADESDPHSEIIGVKNAWITLSDHAEYDVFVNRSIHALAYIPPKIGDQSPLDLKALYNVVLEFSDSQVFGDLNVDYLEDSVQAFHPNVVALIRGTQVDADLHMLPHDQALFDRLKAMSREEFETMAAQTGELLNLTIKVKVQFPRWDETDLKWQDLKEVKKSIQAIDLTFLYLPDDLGIVYKLDEDQNILLASAHEDFKSRPIPFIDEITTRLNHFVLSYTESMLKTYQTKVFKILDILAGVKSRLQAKRNLCEDFFRYKALKIEEILVCADIELDANANVEAVQGQIYFLLDRFLSPTVNFYSLEEILTRDSSEKKYTVSHINRVKNVLTIPSKVKQELGPGSIVSLSGFSIETMELTIVSIQPNPFKSTHTDIQVEESLLNLIESDRGFLFTGRLSEEENRATEKVFEGPALENGFIDDEELKIADRKAFIHASDIINLIMDVEGVMAVKQLQIANFPQDENPDIPSRSVRWCLELAIEQDYVPRLSTSKSKLTFYKNELPFQANSLMVEAIYDELKSEQRPQKSIDPILDFEVPKGEYRELSSYVSIQDDLPLTHGVGPAGVPLDNLDKESAMLRKAHARQLKGFLMVFDQLLANYLAQLDHVKDLFSFNPERKVIMDTAGGIDSEYDFQVDKTYFSQSLSGIVSDSSPLYVNYSSTRTEDENKLHHEEVLQSLTEDEETFFFRRNKFLDHLMARFAEQFTEYALMAYRIDGPKSDLELIEDKQDFLNIYPDISTNRGKASDYKHPLFWFLENSSGLVKRSNFIAGIDPATFLDLHFDPSRLRVQFTNEQFRFQVLDEGEELLYSFSGFDSRSQLNETLEKVILYGLSEENYRTSCREENGKHLLTIELIVEDQVVAWNEDGFGTEEEALKALHTLQAVFKSEFLDNPLSNRNNFALPFDPYFRTEIGDDDIDLDNRTFKITFHLYATPFDFSEAKVLLNGTLEGEIAISHSDSIEEAIEYARKQVRTTFWQIVFWGREDCQYVEREYGLAIIDDRLGEDIAIGIVDHINELLQDIPVKEEGRNPFEIAVSRLSVFFDTNFHRQEGLHLVEHILLRPKINDLWVPIGNRPDILTFIPETDAFIPVERTLTATALTTSQKIIIPGEDLTNFLRFNLALILHWEGDTYAYEVGTYNYDTEKEETIIYPRQALDETLMGNSNLTITYEHLLRIVAIEESDFKLTIREGEDMSNLVEVMQIQIVSARRDRSYGFFKIAVVDPVSRELTLKEFMVQDKLLPVYLPTIDNDIEGNDDCDACKLDNPYSYIAQVVVPAWPGRFDNIDFRRFFEKSIRMEAPAHVFLNICWIGYDQMEIFERNMKTWLLENKRDFPVTPYNDREIEQITILSKAQHDVVDILYQLRNIYPVKTLHDCDESETTEGAIILNKTALGEI